MDKIFFSDWESLIRRAIVGVLAYTILLVLLRISGKRTLSQLSAFDFVVTVALGSTLATILLSKEVTLADGVVAFSLLILLQFLVTWTSVRVQWVRPIVTSEPSLLLYQGKVLEGAMRKERLTKAELQAVMRSAGLTSLDQVSAIVMETDGRFSVMDNLTQTEGRSIWGLSSSFDGENFKAATDQ